MSRSDMPLPWALHHLSAAGFFAAPLYREFSQRLDEILHRLTGLSASVRPGLRLACACSGGADSLLLTLFTAHWLSRQHGDGAKPLLTALIIDHGIRAESLDEAQQTSWFLTRHGIDSVILTVPQAALAHGNVQHQARLVRYRLLSDYCRAHDILFVLTGHHADDAREGFWLNLKRGSGLYGLSEMAACRMIADIHLLRPMLRLKADAIRAHLDNYHIDYVRDASNESDAFARGRLRQAEGTLRQLGFMPERIAQSARHLREAREIIDDLQLQAQAEHCLFHPSGFVAIDNALWRVCHRSLALKILSDAVALLGKSYRPRYRNLCVLADRLTAGESVDGRHIAGVALRQKGDSLFLYPARQKHHRIEDFFVMTPHDDGCFRLDWLGDSGGLKQWQGFADSCPHTRNRLCQVRQWLPSPVLRQLPAMFVGEDLCTVPHFWQDAEADSLPEVCFCRSSAAFDV